VKPSPSKLISKSDEELIAGLDESDSGPIRGEEAGKSEAERDRLEESEYRHAATRVFSVRGDNVHPPETLLCTQASKIWVRVSRRNRNRPHTSSEPKANDPIPHRGADPAIRIVE
jgi:hypothetical protein